MGERFWYEIKMADVVVSSLAYCKILLHAAKFPHRAVNGVLLAEKTKGKDGKQVNFVDAVPLFHQSLFLTPMMEIALMQLEATYKQQGLVIAGYYQANESATDSTPNAIAYRIAERIQEYYDQACLFILDNNKLSIECDEHILRMWKHIEGKWKHIDAKGCVDSSALADASALLQSQAYRTLVDFDNHLDNITLDWKNTEISDILKQTS